MTAQHPSISFPDNPTDGQEFLADNTVTYIWTGNRWSAVQAIQNGIAQYAYDGEYSQSPYEPDIDKTLDGGSA